jgi:pimeloyl-ACP methyl ester carboxylesterase
VTGIRLETRRGQLAALLAEPDSVAGGGAPATVVMIPGLTGGKEDFAEVLPTLASASLRAIAIDLFGQQESDGTDDPGDYTLSALAADLLDLVTPLQVPVHLVGHSFGGIVAKEAVTQWPGVAAGGKPSVASLTLLDSGPAGLPPGRRRDLTQALADSAMSFTPEQAWQLVVQVRSAEGTWPPPDAATAEFQRRRWITTRPAHHAGCARALLSAPDRTEALVAAGLAVAVIHGAEEDAWPAPLQAEMAARLGVPAVSVPASGHSPASENPEATAAALIAFLRQAGGA